MTIIIPPFNRCIYEMPGEHHDGPFSDEHIVPLGLGGEIIIRQASCRSCAKITGKFEQTVLRTMMGPLRIRLKLPTRRPKERPNHLTIRTFTSSGKLKEIVLPAAVVPLCVPGLLLEAPGFLRNVTPTNEVTGRLCITTTMTHREELETFASDGQSVRIARMHADHFLQMIAKIAHCCAIGYWGMDRFTPLLPPLILGKLRHFNYLIGGELEIPPPISSGLHKHQPVEMMINGRIYVGVIVRIFANLKTPQYHVIVGSALPQLAQEIEEATKHTDERIPYVFRQ